MERFRERVLIVAGADVTVFCFPSNVPYIALEMLTIGKFQQNCVLCYVLLNIFSVARGQCEQKQFHNRNAIVNLQDLHFSIVH